MEDTLTPQINEHSIETIRREIARKNSPNPYFANNQTILNVVTDMDHHPYDRWFRGVYYYPDPIIFEREAGYRKQNNSCYNVIQPRQKEEQPHNCYEVACTTTLPCYPADNLKYAERERLRRMINNNCIVQYR